MRQMGLACLGAIVEEISGDATTEAPADDVTQPGDTETEESATQGGDGEDATGVLQ